MNKRIKELVEQADLIQWDTLPSGARTPDHESVVKAKKFAELLINETITEMCQQLHWHGDDQSNNPAFYKAIDKTKEHFGII